MNRKNLILLLMTFTFSLFAQSYEWQWANQAGATGYDEGHGIVLDREGNSYVTGCFNGTAIFDSISILGNGDYDIFVAKMDTQGNWLWVTSAGSSGYDNSRGITIDDAGNLYIVGSFQNTALFGPYSITSSGGTDIFVAKMDANGNWLWATQAGSYNDDGGSGIALDDNYNSYITGYFWGTATFGSYSITSNGSFDTFVAKLDANGNWVWAKQAGGINESDRGSSIVVDEFAQSHVVGYFRDTATFGPHTLSSYGGEDIFVAKLDTNGNWLWVSQSSGNGTELGLDIAIDNHHNSYITGNFRHTAIFDTISIVSNGYTDIFVAKIDVNGNWLWAEHAGGSDFDIGKSIDIDFNGNSYITGYFQETAEFGSFSLSSFGDEDFYVAQIDSQGNWAEVMQAGGNYSDRGFDIAVDDYNNLFLTGCFSDNIDFGSYSLISSGSHDIFVTRYDFYFSDFVADNTLGYFPLLVNFTDLSIGNPSNWEWDFDNDGVIDSYEQNPTYIYSQPGIYTVVLTVSDGINTDTEVKVNYIAAVEELTVDFEADPTSGSQPLEVQFTDLSTGNPLTWLWDFDNDSFIDSNEQNPTYIYDEAGIYTISLTISDGINTHTEIKMDYVTVSSVSSDIELLSLKTQLYSNHPNPFNPLTSIQLDIKENETGILSIFNIKGQIIESHQFESGKYNYLWDASKQASGIYFYKLKTQAITVTRKMLLLK